MRRHTIWLAIIGLGNACTLIVGTDTRYVEEDSSSDAVGTDSSYVTSDGSLDHNDDRDGGSVVDARPVSTDGCATGCLMEAGACAQTCVSIFATCKAACAQAPNMAQCKQQCMTQEVQCRTTCETACAQCLDKFDAGSCSVSQVCQTVTSSNN